MAMPHLLAAVSSTAVIASASCITIAVGPKMEDEETLWKPAVIAKEGFTHNTTRRTRPPPPVKMIGYLLPPVTWSSLGLCK